MGQAAAQPGEERLFGWSIGVGCGSHLTAEQAQELDDTFLSSDPFQYFRSRIEKEGLAEGLTSQILERKTIDRILEFVKFEEVPLEAHQEVETLDQSAASGDREAFRHLVVP